MSKKLLTLMSVALVAILIATACGGEEATPIPVPTPTPTPSPAQIFEDWVEQNFVIAGTVIEGMDVLDQIGEVIQGLATGQITSFEEAGIDLGTASAQLGTTISGLDSIISQLSDLEPPTGLSTEHVLLLGEGIALSVEGIGDLKEALELIKRVIDAGSFDLLSLASLAPVPQLTGNGLASLEQAGDNLAAVASDLGVELELDIVPSNG
ncbi:MAG: hypothetical protein V3U90_05960 [Dehalococcoidia bacterium]